MVRLDYHLLLHLDYQIRQGESDTCGHVNAGWRISELFSDLNQVVKKPKMFFLARFLGLLNSSQLQTL